MGMLNDTLDLSGNWKTDYVTRDGRAAEILTVDNGGSAPIVYRAKRVGGVNDGQWGIFLCELSGRQVPHDFYPGDLLKKAITAKRRLVLFNTPDGPVVVCFPLGMAYNNGVYGAPLGSAIVELREGQFDPDFDDGKPF